MRLIPKGALLFSLISIFFCKIAVFAKRHQLEEPLHRYSAPEEDEKQYRLEKYLNQLLHENTQQVEVVLDPSTIEDAVFSEHSTSIVLTGESLQEFRDRLTLIRQYMNDLHKSCIDKLPTSRSSVFLHAFIQTFLEALTKGIELDEVKPINAPKIRIKIKLRDLSKFLGGLRVFFDLKKEIYAGQVKDFLGADIPLVEAAENLIEILYRDGEESTDARYETPLKQALREIQRGIEPLCAVGASAKDIEPPTLDLTRAKLMIDSNPEDGKIPEFGTGSTLKFQIPAFDRSGLRTGDLTSFTFRRKSDGSYIYISTRPNYDKKMKLLTYEMNSRNLKPGHWVLSRISNLNDELGNSYDSQEISKSPIEFDFHFENPDITPPVIDFKNIQFITRKKTHTGAGAQVEAGRSLRISIPLKDEGSGLQDQSYGYLKIHGPEGVLSNNYYGRIRTDHISFDVALNRYSKPGIYKIEEISNVYDKVGNAASGKPEFPITFEVINRDPDLEGALADFGSIEFRTDAGVQTSHTVKIEAGQKLKIAIPVMDKKSGMENGASAQLLLTNWDGKGDLNLYGNYKAEEGKMLFDMEPGVFTKSCKYKIRGLRDLTDRAGNKAHYFPHGEMVIEIIEKNPDTHGPVADFSKLKFVAGSKKNEAGQMEVQAGFPFEISIPVSDDISGVKDTEYARLSLSGPEGSKYGKRYLTASGKVSAANGLAIFQVAPSEWLEGGIYTVGEIYGIYDVAGNSTSDQKPQSPITFVVKPKNPDTKAPEVDFDKLRFSVGSETLKEVPIQFDAGSTIQVSVPVKDDLSGIDESYTPSISFSSYTRDWSYSNFYAYGKYDPATQQIRFEIKTNPHLSSRKYSLGNVGVRDRAENQGSPSPKQPITFELVSKDPDTTPPVVHFEKLQIKSKKPNNSNEKFEFEIGDELELFLPISDDKAGFEDDFSAYITVGAPGKLDSITAWGKYDKGLGGLRFKIESSQTLQSGKYSIKSLSSLSDKAENPAKQLSPKNSIEFIIKEEFVAPKPPGQMSGG